MSQIIADISQKFTEMTTSVPAKCHVMIFEEANKGLVYKEVDTPKPKPGEVLIKSVACMSQSFQHL